MVSGWLVDEGVGEADWVLLDLVGSTPTCSASRDDRYTPTTVRFYSNGSLTRSSAYASSAGYYSANTTRTNTVSDGVDEHRWRLPRLDQRRPGLRVLGG